MAAARVYENPGRPLTEFPPFGSLLFWSALSLLPDVDVVGLSLGVRYESAWGHRGATHSLLFTLALGLLIGLAAPAFGRRALSTAAAAALVLVSHPLLDTLTNGGFGCALLWPVDHTRYFAPWQPLPVPPIGLAYFSQYGLHVALVETVIFSPILLFALWPVPAQPAARA